MNVKELLTRTPINEVLDALVFHYYAERGRVADVRADYTMFIESLAGLQPVLSDHIVLGMSLIDLGKPTYSACLYVKTELAAWYAKPSPLADVDPEELSLEETERLLDASTMPETYAFEFTPWNEILGYEVDEGSIANCGAGPLLADILYAMSFFGFDERGKDEPLRSLEESAREYEEIKKLPPEEQEQHFHTMDDIYAELGWERPVRTLEEEAMHHRVVVEDMLCNRLHAYKCLMQYKATIEGQTAT